MPERAMLKFMSFLSGDTDVAFVARTTGLTTTALRFGGIVTA
jgi:hypothetical protein